MVETQQLLHQQGKLKILGHFDKSPIQTIVLSLIQYKAHSVSSFICANRAGGNRKHLIKSKLIFQQFELTELCYDGSRQRILPHSLTERKGLFCVVTWFPWVLMYFCAVSYQSLITFSPFQAVSSLTNKHIMHLEVNMTIPFIKIA